MEKHIHIPIANGQGHITWYGPIPPSQEFIKAINRIAEKIINLPEPELTKIIERTRYITESLSKDPKVIRRNMLHDLGIALPIQDIKITLGQVPEIDPDAQVKFIEIPPAKITAEVIPIPPAKITAEVIPIPPAPVTPLRIREFLKWE